MRLSDLVEKPVYDQAGRSLGQIHDARLIQDGPVLSSGMASFRLHGVIAGNMAFGTRLGFDRGDVRGPFLFKWLFRFLGRHAIYITWGQIASIEGGRIVVVEPSDGFPKVRDMLGGSEATVTA